MSATTTPQTDQPNAGRKYTKSLRVVKQLRLVLPLIAVGAYVYFGLPQWFASLARMATNHFYLQVALCWIPLWIACAAASLLVSCYSFRLDRRFQLSNSSLGQWLLGSLKANILAFFIGGSVIEVAFVSHNLSPLYDWILAGSLCSLLFLGVAVLTPWILSLFYPVQPLVSDTLRARLTVLASKAGVPTGTISEWHISGHTRKANALVAGFGSARRILLTDTLINTLSEDEVEALVAHELGHCALHHTSKRLALQSLTFWGIFWLIDAAVNSGLIPFTGENTGWTDLGLLPGILVAWIFGYAYSAILVAMLSRKQEKAADLFGWNLIGGADHFITAMQKLTALNLVVFDKNSQWKYTHPATAVRIEAAQEYARTRGAGNIATAAAAQGTE